MKVNRFYPHHARTNLRVDYHLDRVVCCDSTSQFPDLREKKRHPKTNTWTPTPY